MTNLDLYTNSGNFDQSPFDSIRRYRADGSEYWEARELMKMMGYRNWQNFETAIKDAIENLEITGDNAADHFLLLSVKSAGRAASSYELTRYASYMTALCCDGRKPEVAAAKKYFALKTREAETVIPAQQAKIRELELMVRLKEAEATAAVANKQLMDTRYSVIQLRGSESLATSLILGATVVQVDNVVEKVIDKASGRTYDGIGIAEIAKRLGFRKTQECWQCLESIGYGKDTEVWELQLSAVEHHKLNRNALDDIIKLWNQGKRQRLIGEM